jgi:hypothetical protein
MTDAGTGPLVAGFGAVLLQAIGVDAYMIAVAAIGAVGWHAHSTHTVGAVRAVLQVGTSAVIGAIIGQAVFELTALQSVAARAALCGFFGFAVFRLFEELAKRSAGVIGSIADRWGKGKGGDQ